VFRADRPQRLRVRGVPERLLLGLPALQLERRLSFRHEVLRDLLSHGHLPRPLHRVLGQTKDARIWAQGLGFCVNRLFGRAEVIAGPPLSIASFMFAVFMPGS
jgi:hypothetical protein